MCAACLSNVWCLPKDDPARSIGTFLFLILSVWKLGNACMWMSIELKADLIGSVAVELSHVSVTHHRTLGSHDSLIIWGIVWSLSIIKTNHRPAACRLSVIVCLWIACPPHSRSLKGVSVHKSASFCLFFFCLLFVWLICPHLLVHVPLSFFVRDFNGSSKQICTTKEKKPGHWHKNIEKIVM